MDDTRGAEEGKGKKGHREAASPRLCTVSEASQRLNEEAKNPEIDVAEFADSGAGPSDEA